MITALLFLLAGIANAYMDKIQNWYNSRWADLPDNHKWTKFARPYKHFQGTLYDFNIGTWKRKWKLDANENIIPYGKSYWYYLWLIKIDYKERFMWSSTALVRFTDGWHCFQGVWITLVCLGAYFWKPMEFNGYIADWLMNLIAIFGAYLLGFNIFYQFVLNKKKTLKD